MFEKILAATDGSEHGLRAAKVAVELGKISGGKVYAVYVADTQRTAHLPDDMLLFSIKELLLKEGKIRYAGTPAEVMKPAILEEIFRIRADVVPLPDGTPHCIPTGSLLRN